MAAAGLGTTADLKVELGREGSHTWLVVDTEGKTALHAVPSDANELVRVLVARVVRVRPDSGGTVRLGPLPAGEYEVCRGDEPMGERVVVNGKETRIELPSGR